jgi:hypothetical protein
MLLTEKGHNNHETNESGFVNVTGYRVIWNSKDKTKAVQLLSATEFLDRVDVNSVAELEALVNLLRRRKSAQYDKANTTLSVEVLPAAKCGT